MAITASLVNELREKTGVGLMDCKKVLVETQGDIELAVKKLREKGLAKAAKKSDRATKEGRVFIQKSNDKAVILELNCETDFVGSNEQFSECGNVIAKAILDSTINSVDSIEKLQINGQSYKDFVSEYVLKLGENITVKKFQLISDASTIESYIHMNGKIGVLVSFSDAISEDVSKGIAMHIAAVNPSYLTIEDIDSAELDNERSIIKNQSLKEGKPENIVDKIVEGRIAKYYKEVCLLEQAYIKDDKQSIKQILPKDVSINTFIRFALS